MLTYEPIYWCKKNLFKPNAHFTNSNDNILLK